MKVKTNRSRRSAIGLLLGIALLVVALAPAAHGQSKVGWVDLDRILTEYQEFREAEDLFRQDAAIWEADFDSVQDVYFSRLDLFERQKLTLQPDTRRSHEQELVDLERIVLETKARLEQQAERRKSELTAPILQKIQETVEKVANDEDYDFILNASQIYMTAAGMQFGPIMYARKKLDLTDRVFEELDKLK